MFAIDSNLRLTTLLAVGKHLIAGGVAAPPANWLGLLIAGKSVGDVSP